VLALRYNHPREGPLIGDMDVQTVEGGHLDIEWAKIRVPTTPHCLFSDCGVVPWGDEMLTEILWRLAEAVKW